MNVADTTSNVQESQSKTLPEESLLEKSNDLKLTSKPSSGSTAAQEETADPIAPIEVSRAVSYDCLSSEVQSSLVKQEEPTPEQIQFKLRRKVCKKIRAILHEHLGLKLIEAEKYTLLFEQTVFSAFSTNIQEYIQVIKSVCCRVKVGPV